MNQFDDYFEFRLARKDEVSRIMEFIRMYWGNPNHILATDEDFFRYEYCPQGKPDVYLAVEKKSGLIAAIHCLYFYSKEHQPDRTDMSTGMFLANPTIRVPFVGIELHKRVLDTLRPRSYISPGVNLTTSAPLLRRFLKHKVERMCQFYLLGNVQDYKIAHIVNRENVDNPLCEIQIDLKEYHTAEELYAAFDDKSFQQRMPYKDPWYVERRYFHHPIYQYRLFGIAEKAVLVCRELEAEGRKLLRIVDILGDPSQLRYVGKSLRNLVDQNGYEYLDLYEQKMNDEDLLLAGFTERMENDENIIPNYFEPFVRENIEIWVNRRDESSFCFKADGDQDRPNHR